MRNSQLKRRTGSLAGRVAVVTGGSSGIGKAVVELFVSEDAAVSVVDKDEARGEKLVQSIRNTGREVLFVKGDVSVAADCKQAVKETLKKFNGLDILVNNAGIVRRATVVETRERDWDRVMAVNVKSVFLLSKYAVPAMARGKGGVIVNIASGWGLAGGKRAAAYCASKGAVVLLTKAMAIDHARQNIRVNCICPGDVDTPLLRSEARQLGEPVKSFLEESAYRPLGRIGKPEEIAQAVLFLAGDASAYITGTALVVDGGGLAGFCKGI